MNRIILVALASCLIPTFAFAEDADKAPSAKAVVATKEETQTADEKSPVDWVKVESTGTIGTGKEGALEKTIWKGQDRTEIEFLLQKLPTNFGLRSVLGLQRRLLLSKVDSALINNDVGPLRGNDLLIQRINKLMDMGLYDDAWELYTQKADDTYDVSIAQMGMQLLVMKNDLATACLEEKVFSAKFPKDKFFGIMDRACSQTLGGTSAPKFDDSAVLQAVYNNPSYSVSAKDADTFMKMSDLERALVLANGKIKYDGLTADILSKTPSTLVALYLMDKKLPDNAKALIANEIDKRGMKWYTASIARDENWAKAKAIHDVPSQWPYIESALKSGANPADIGKYYADMLEESEPANLSTDITIKALSVLLASGRELPEYWLKAAQKAATEKPIVYIYLQAFKSLTATPKAEVSSENLKKALQGLKPADCDQILAIIESLDKEAKLLDTPLIIYDKHSDLTLIGDYVMPTVGLNVLLETAPEKKQIGITVLAVLNSLAAKPDNMYSGTVRKALYSMLSVGLIEDAKQIGSETVASVLSKY